MATYDIIKTEDESTLEMVVQTVTLPIDALPRGYNHGLCGWRILTGGASFNVWARVLMADEVEDQQPTD